MPARRAVVSPFVMTETPAGCSLVAGEAASAHTSRLPFRPPAATHDRASPFDRADATACDGAENTSPGQDATQQSFLMLTSALRRAGLLRGCPAETGTSRFGQHYLPHGTMKKAAPWRPFCVQEVRSQKRPRAVAIISTGRPSNARRSMSSAWLAARRRVQGRPM